MIAVKGIIQDGQVVLPIPVNLPDGTEVTVISSGQVRSIGLSEEEWPTDPDGIARLVDRMTRVEPLDVSPEEEADIEAWRRR